MATEAENQAIEKITFTPEQQARVDQIVKEAMGRAASDLRTDLTKVNSEKTQLEADLAAAKAAAKAATTTTEKKAANEDVAALQAQINEMKTANGKTQDELERMRKITADKDTEIAKAKNESLDVRKQVAISNAAGKLGFVDVSQVADLTSKSVKFDEQRGRFVVYSSDGTERLNSSYEPMSLEEYYKEFADKNPHFVRGEAKGGTGSTQSTRSNSSASAKYEVGQIFGPKSNSQLANKLAQENLPEYRRLKAQAREAGLVA